MADPKDKKTPAPEAAKPADLDSALARIADLERAHEALRTERDALRGERDSLRSEREAMRNEHELALRGLRDERASERQTFEARLRESAGALHEATDSLRDARAENARLREAAAQAAGATPARTLPPDDAAVKLVARRGLRLALRDGTPVKVHAHVTFTASLREMREAGFALGDAFDLAGG